MGFNLCDRLVTPWRFAQKIKAPDISVILLTEYSRRTMFALMGKWCCLRQWCILRKWCYAWRCSGQTSHHSRPSGATSLWAKRITSLLRKQKHHSFTARKQNGSITHYTQQARRCEKKDGKRRPAIKQVSRTMFALAGKWCCLRQWCILRKWCYAWRRSGQTLHHCDHREQHHYA